MRSRSLAKLLRHVLAAGNAVNAGSSKGGASAVKLASLLAAARTRGADGKTTLLDGVVGLILDRAERRQKRDSEGGGGARSPTATERRRAASSNDASSSRFAAEDSRDPYADDLLDFPERDGILAALEAARGADERAVAADVAKFRREGLKRLGREVDDAAREFAPEDAATAASRVVARSHARGAARADRPKRAFSLDGAVSWNVPAERTERERERGLSPRRRRGFWAAATRGSRTRCPRAGPPRRARRSGAGWSASGTARPPRATPWSAARSRRCWSRRARSASTRAGASKSLGGDVARCGWVFLRRWPADVFRFDERRRRRRRRASVRRRYFACHENEALDAIYATLRDFLRALCESRDQQRRGRKARRREADRRAAAKARRRTASDPRGGGAGGLQPTPPAGAPPPSEPRPPPGPPDDDLPTVDHVVARARRQRAAVDGADADDDRFDARDSWAGDD